MLLPIQLLVQFDVLHAQRAAANCVRSFPFFLLIASSQGQLEGHSKSFTPDHLGYPFQGY